MDFFTSLKNYLSEDLIEKLKNCLESKNIRGLFLNHLKMPKNTFLNKFPLIKQHPYVENGFIFDDNIYDFNKHIYHELGVYYLQEPSAMIVSSLIKPSTKPYKILDLCSAPGGKLIQIAINQSNATIIANDISFKRCQAIIENVERLGLNNVIVTNNDFSKIYNQYLNYFDIIILDAPCSGSGMFRKDSKMIDDWSYNKVLKFANEQKQLLDIAYKMLAKGGKILYSTCSYSYEEDEEVIAYILNKYNDLKHVMLDISKNFYVDKINPYGFHIFPFMFSGEGHYIALLSKDGEQSLSDLPKGEIKKDDYVYLINHSIKITNLNILRYGIKYKKIFNNKDFALTYHYSHSFNLDKLSNVYHINLDIEQLNKYMKGESLKLSENTKINQDSTPCFVLLTYDDVAVSYAKLNGNILKNCLPKYLKNKKYIF